MQMPGGYTFNHVDTLKRVELYYNSRFESGEFDEEGMQKYFYNIVKPACDVAEKMTDLDTKDIRLIPERAEDERILWLMGRDLKQWLKDTNFAKLMNEINHDYSKYGHVVIKKLRSGRWEKVNVVNMRCDPSSPTLDESPFVYEVLTMSKHEIREMKAWDQDAKDELFLRSPKDTLFTVYECYDVNIEEGKRWVRTIKADLLRSKSVGGQALETAESQLKEDVELLPSVILHQDEVDELPYRELKWEDVDGRWLGQGIVEYLFDNQIKVNEIENLEGRALYLNALQLFQTSDEQIASNLLMSLPNGAVIQTPTGIQRVDTEERGLSGFNNARGNWSQNTQAKTFAFDVIQGDTGPSGTTLGATQIAAGMAQSYFNLKRENFGLFLKALILDDILPAFKRINRKEHIVKFLGSDGEIEKVYRAVAEATLRKSLISYVRRVGLMPDLSVIQTEKKKVLDKLRKRKDIFFSVVEAAYDDVKAKVDVIITGESMNVGAMTNTLQVAMQMIGGNPQLLQDRPTRTIFFKLLALTGVSPVDINAMEEAAEDDVGFGQAQGPAQPAAPNVPPANRTPISAPPKEPGFEQVPSSAAL